MDQDLAARTQDFQRLHRVIRIKETKTKKPRYSKLTRVEKKWLVLEESSSLRQCLFSAKLPKDRVFLFFTVLLPISFPCSQPCKQRICCMTVDCPTARFLRDDWMLVPRTSFMGRDLLFTTDRPSHLAWAQRHHTSIDAGTCPFRGTWNQLLKFHHSLLCLFHFHLCLSQIHSLPLWTSFFHNGRCGCSQLQTLLS